MARRKSLQPDVPPLSPLPPPTATLNAVWKGVLFLLISAYVGFSIVHVVSTPMLPVKTSSLLGPPEDITGSLINAPDETAHIGYIRLLAVERRLPTNKDRDRTYEWHQPPLYYLLAVPFYQAGERGVRWFGVALGALSLTVLFLAARRLFPDDPGLAVLALGLAALLPMRQAVYAAADNDSLLELLFSLALYHVALAFTNGFTVRRAGWLGLTLGLALLTKASALVLVPVILVVLVLLRRGGESMRAVMVGGAYLIVLALALAGPWYARNYRLYHEFTPVKAFMHDFEGTSKAVDWIGQPVADDLMTGELVPAAPMSRAGYLRLVGDWTSRTFLAAFTPPIPRMVRNGIPRFMPPTFYVPYLVLGIAALAGLTRLHFRRQTDFTGLQRMVIGLFWLTIALVLVVFVGFVWTYFQAQGRYLYPALLPGSILAALGYRGLFAARYREPATGLILCVLGVLAVAFLVVGVLPAYS